MKDAEAVAIINKVKWEGAIDKSIVKWEGIAILKKGMEKTQCAMCFLGKQLLNDPDVLVCSACPMTKATGQKQCKGTPWSETSNTLWPKPGVKPGCDADYEMLLTLYMLKVIYPNVEE